jgi:hypothetical protein
MVVSKKINVIKIKKFPKAAHCVKTTNEGANPTGRSEIAL